MRRKLVAGEAFALREYRLVLSGRLSRARGVSTPGRLLRLDPPRLALGAAS